MNCGQSIYRYFDFHLKLKMEYTSAHFHFQLKLLLSTLIMIITVRLEVCKYYCCIYEVIKKNLQTIDQ